MDLDFREQLADRLTLLRERVARAAERVGRRPEEVRILGASKAVPVERLAVACDLGFTLFGENYVQEALPKLRALPQAEWHFIGRLQRNKARHVVGAFALIQSVDRLDLAAELSRRAAAAGLRQPVLVEVNLGDEPTKGGVAYREASDLIARVEELEGLRVLGLMGMPPWSPDAEASRPYYAALKSLHDAHYNHSWQVLSMGMSGDYEVAVEEGSTLIRVGTALFGSRQATP